MQPPATLPAATRISFVPVKSGTSGAGALARAQWKAMPSASATHVGCVPSKITAPAGIPAATCFGVSRVAAATVPLAMSATSAPARATLRIDRARRAARRSRSVEAERTSPSPSRVGVSFVVIMGSAPGSLRWMVGDRSSVGPGGQPASDGGQASVDPDPGGVRGDVELAPDFLVGLIGEDAELDRTTLAVRELGKRGGQVVVEAGQPRLVGSATRRGEVERQPVDGGSLDAPSAYG